MMIAGTETIMWRRVGKVSATNRSFTAGLYAMGMKRPRHYHYPPHHARHRIRRGHRNASGGATLVGLGSLGALVTTGWTIASPEQQAATLTAARDIGVATEIGRAHV